MDATEYLSRVVQQSKQLPDVFTSPAPAPAPATSTKTKIRRHQVPIEGSAASLSYLLSDRTALVPPPTDAHACASEWVDRTLSNFSQLRLYLDHQVANTATSTSTSTAAERKLPVPPLKDQTGWHIFCLGEQEARGNVGAYFAHDNDDDDNDDNDDNDDETATETETETKDNRMIADNSTVEQGKEEEPEEPWRRNLPENGYAPTTSLMLQLDQVMTRRVLAHLVHYVQEGWYPCSVQRTLWLYALLARLEKPVHRNEAAVLYALLQALTQTRAATRSDDRPALARLNTIIVITGLYFEQGGGFQHVMQPATTNTNNNNNNNVSNGS
jgi:gem associated protein 2